MEDHLESILLKLNIPSQEINSQVLQDVLVSMKKISPDGEYGKTIDKILDKLWVHLIINLPTFDDQLLSSTCFYTILINSGNQEKYLTEVANILNAIITLDVIKDNKDKKLLLGMSLMYGLFQSPYLTQNKNGSMKKKDFTHNILKVTYRILMLKAYEYSQYTFIVFKTISSFKKVIGTAFQQTIFNRDNQINILNVTNHNWENPVTGIRNLNRTIFNTLISIVDKDIYNQIIQEINIFYWNKAKFLMLTEIIEQSQGTMHILLHKNNWIEGIIYSLHKPGLVSAGSDMYYSVLKKINTDQEWCEIFLKPLLKIYESFSQKAIENFNNYWCLITLKKFPKLMEKFLTELSKLEYSEYTLLSCLSIMKQGNKIGLLGKHILVPEHYNVKNDRINEGLIHCNPHIRIMAFDIVCVLHGKSLPAKYEYETILRFLLNNVNSDCTVLRINMINSFSSFLTYLHHAFLINFTHDHLCIQELQYFCTNLQNFIKMSLNIDGNYQRKITTVKLIDLIFKHLNSMPTKQRSKNESKVVLIEKLKIDNAWILSDKKFILKLICLLKDPAEDVRNSVLQVLLNYYNDDLKSADFLNLLIEDAFKCTQSKFFYDIDCGKIIFKLIINIILKEKQVEGRFQKVEDVFDHWYNELTHEIKLDRNIVDSITEGKQFHSILGILCIIFESCLEYKYKLDITRDSIMRLINILENVSNQFMQDEKNTCSFDFSKMSEMVETLIKTSSYSSHENDETKISGLHQMVLSCLWLNVKASCDISLFLIMYNIEDEGICAKCLNIITHVLETCRHKGAIEAAGTALGKSIQYLTGLPSISSVSKLPLNLLEQKLKDLIFEANVMASVTRRGAGLSIMVHRIVSSDVKKGKPLFHYFINVLLKTCKEANDTVHCKEGNENEKDLPKAIFIHFLTKIVTDSSLASEMMYYSAKLAELAFENLTSPHWQIRNAALQLYGALVPKLIGQKKASGFDDETVATVACDEFRTHSPKLWTFILLQLKQINHCDDIQEHSNLVPILNILANIAKRYNFLYDIKDQSVSDMQLLNSLKILLGSPIYTVRRLVSKCILNIYSFEAIYKLLMDYMNTSENSLHGILMLMEEFSKTHNESLSADVYNMLREKYTGIIRNRQHSYLNREIFERILMNKDLILNGNAVSEVCSEVTKNMHLPGAYIWANFRIKFFIETATWEILAKNLQTLLVFNEFESYTNFFCEKLDCDCPISEKSLSDIASILISSSNAENSYGIWKFLYMLSNKLNLNVEINSHIIQTLLNKDSYRTRYFIPFAAKIFTRSLEIEKLEDISNIIYALCDPGKNDTDMRIIAALANNELTFAFSHVSDNIKINAIKSAIILLQDEDENVRNLSTQFYHHITNEKSKQAFISFNSILSRTFLESVLDKPDEAIKIIEKDLTEFISLLRMLDKDCYNPFANDSKNIYLEINVIRQLLDNLNKND